jgi:hypothetical protein
MLLMNNIFQKALGCLHVALSIILAMTLIIPQPQSVSFCNPMDLVMLQSCCHSQEVEQEDGQDSVSGPDCCDEVALPDLEADRLPQLHLPVLVVTSSVVVDVPVVEWTLVVDIEEKFSNISARGPPHNSVPIFTRNSSYLL